MVGTIRINFYTGNEPLDFFGNSSYIAEDLVIESCKYLHIGPVARHLFGLWSFSQSLWFPPSKELKVPDEDILNFYLRLRFRTPNITSLKEKTDSSTLNYYFRQAHIDFLEGRIPELYHGNLRESALGLVATDIICEMIEENVTVEEMRSYKKIFIPQILRKNPLSDGFLHEPLRKAVARGLANAKNNSEFVKENYLQGLTELVPDYGTETYTVLIEKTENGKLFEVELVVNPYHPDYPGLRMRLKRSKGDWTHICDIENLCYISMRSDETVEISRQNGVPQYIQFNDTAQRHSFVSFLDGYYRLSEKWTFNLCKDLPTPSLLKLRAMKCHGPVSVSFAHRKLEEKSNNDVGCYIIRECEFMYDVYYVDIWISTKSEGSENISTFKIIKDDEGMFVLEGWSESFKSIPQLLSYHANENMLNFQRCIPPSEYDESNLLLCRRQKQGFSSLKTRGDCSCTAQCIPHDAIMFCQDVSTMPGRLTIVAQARLRRSCTDSRAVAVKMLRKETKVTHLKEFLAQCDKMLYWQHDAIVSTVGMILTNPTALVMEWLPLGTLDRYLENRTDVQEVDLIEAAYHLARALWYLDEQRMVHGNIRCHNILVSSHGESCFKVKLADPGIITYTDADIHWIPPECYDDYSRASKSILADVYAYGTTVWQIISRGGKPMPLLTPKQAKEHYLKNLGLGIPSTCQEEMGKLIEECWFRDPDNRKQPQSIVRDVNSILYQIYDSRRTHSYAVVDERAITKVESPEKPPLPTRRPPVKDSSRNILKKIKWPVTAPFRGFNYNVLSQSRSTLNASSANSTTSFLTEDRENDENFDEPSQSNSLISICDVFPSEILLDNHIRDPSSIISYHNLTIKGKLGEGFYGEVLKADFFNPVLLKPETVAVKRIKAKDSVPHIRVNELHAEMKIMKSLCHKNIVRIIGLVEDPETMLVMEYVDNGSLLCHLQSYKNKQEELEHKELIRFALGVAEGMEYLETQNIVHRDLAARNILVGSKDAIKISDFGLAQEIKDHYYRMTTDRNIPIRWYALEAIVASKFSHKSDVWSYGVTLWEIFSYGDNPQIKNVPDTALHEALQKGQRLGLPYNCPSLERQGMEKEEEDRGEERRQSGPNQEKYDYPD
ncbi:Tyrosine-protein kinase JAK2 like protein [Argiope bruennichi]|uniref:Tyrosine-protein kinase n=1 Tax=Argiope bruennichi TaxID=94029 RepID=A0A8T0G149_ARGBR|nr:Tyrosine-protein kinase JAK2 like protein [Argiope bruennichi]